MEETLNHQTHVFDSGLKLVTVAMPATKTVTVMVIVGTGSKYETKNINGISHFLEHMMFKGTAKRPGNLDIARELDSIGAEYNAFTGKEHTAYYARTSIDKLDTALDVISDIFLNSRLDEKDIEIEKGVIVEEINMYKDDPPRYVGSLLERLMYGDQPAGWDIAGDKETVTALKQSDFRHYFDTHYIAENTIVSVAGNIDSEEVKSKTAKIFENIRQGQPSAKLTVAEEQTAPQLLLHYKETDQSHLAFGLRGYHMFDDRRYAASLLGIILGGGMSSRLFQEVRVKRGLAYYIGSDHESYTDTGIFSVSAGVDKTRTLEAVKVILEELQKARDKNVTAEELQKAKDHIKGSMALYLENSRNIAVEYGDSLLFEKKVLTPEEKLAKIQSVTLADVHLAAKEIFMDPRLNLALIGPFKEENEFKNILNV